MNHWKSQAGFPVPPPEGDWLSFVDEVTGILAKHGIEMLSREELLRPAPSDMEIPTAFDPPYHVFDTLFYWED